LLGAVDFAIQKFGFDADAFVHELTDSIIGDNYPVPDRALVHNEMVTHEYLMWAMCQGPPPGRKIRPLSGRGRHGRHVLHLQGPEERAPAQRWRHHCHRHADLHTLPGDADLEDYALQKVYIQADQEDQFQFTDEELTALEDPKVKALFLVNPGNPSSVALDPRNDRASGQVRAREAPGSDDPDRRRLRHLHADFES
jgi:aspartate 4-decarboxylase